MSGLLTGGSSVVCGGASRGPPRGAASPGWCCSRYGATERRPCCGGMGRRGWRVLSLPHRCGIGPKRAERIVGGWAEQKVIREIMLFLHSNGVGTSRAVRIYKTYRAEAVQLISENPYRLARDIRGIGFCTADQIAAKLGIEKTALIRVRAGIAYALTEAMDEGHCGLPAEEL